MKVVGCRVQVISRGKGRSAVAAAAYRAGEKIKNEWDGQPHNYTRRQGVIYTEIFAPGNAPDWMHDRPLLWNSIEQFEKAKNAQLAREFQIDLPLQLSQKQNIELAKEYAQQLVKEGMVVDLCVHAPDKENPNPHSHIMATMRPLNQDGTWGAKSISQHILDENGEKIKLPNGNYKSRKINTTDWDTQDKVEFWRERYAELTNQYLERYGHFERVTHESYERQGIDQVAKIRLSRIDYEREQRGIQTEKGDINRAIEAENQYREKARQTLEHINKAIEKEEARQQQEERKKVAGQGKEREAEAKEPVQSPHGIDRYKQSQLPKLVRDPERHPRRYVNPYKDAQNRKHQKEQQPFEHKAEPRHGIDRYKPTQPEREPAEIDQQPEPTETNHSPTQKNRRGIDRYHERLKRKQYSENGKDHEEDKDRER